MVTRRDRRRFKRAADRAIRPSRRASTASAITIVLRALTTVLRAIATVLRLSRRVWSWSVIGVAALLLYVVYAFPARIESRKADVAQPARPVTVTEPSREANERRLSEIRQVHLGQLQPVLRTDAQKLSEVARRIRADGRVTDINKDRSATVVELRSLFVSHGVLSGDLQNHYQEYSQAKERLRRNVSEHEAEFYTATSLLTTKLSLPPGAEHRRLEVARSLLEKCLGKGPGTAVAEDEFTAFLSDSDVTAHCESLKKRAARIAANADKLSAEALVLAQRTTLPGECKYTKLD